MRLLGVDLGGKRTGLALGDDLLGTASAYDVLHIADQSQLLQAVVKVIEKEQPDTIVVGLPLNMDGSVGPSAKRATSFAKQLARYVEPTPVELHDERLTSAQADEHLLAGELTRKQKKKRQDAVAAAVLLTDYMQARGRDPRE